MLRLTPPWEINHDVSCFLYAADRVLDGEVLYRDFVDVNLPLVVYASMLPAWLARVAGGGFVLAFDLFVVAIVAASLVLSARVARRGAVGFLAEPAALCVLVFALLVVPGRDFGQREHLMVVLSLPYLVTQVVRLGDSPPDRGSGWLVGAFAAVGFAFKPFFLIVPFCVALGMLLARRRFRPLAWPENLALLGGLTLYVAHFFLVPYRGEFVSTMWQAWRGYGAYEVDIGEIFGHPWSQRALWAGAALSVGAVFIRNARGPLWVLLSAWVGAIIGSLVQAKGWSYQLLPAVLFGWLGLAFVLGLKGWWRGLVAPALLLAVAVPLGQHWLERDPESQALRGSSDYTGIPPALIEVRELGPGDSVVVLDTDMQTFFGWLVENRVQWASRFSCLWPVPGALLDTRLRRELVSAVVDDLQRYRPKLLYVRQSPVSFVPDPSFELVDWLREDLRFRELLSEYVAAESVPGFSVWRKR